MKIAIVVAMDKELSLLLEQLNNLEHKESDGLRYHIGRIGNNDILVSKCGIGKINAALNVQKFIDIFHPDLVINTGVAGGAGTRMQIGQLLVATEAAYHDTWCGFDSKEGQADGCPERFAADTGLIEKAKETLDPNEVKYGLICTGDRFIDSPEEVARINGIYPDVMAVDMESAAIAHACHRNGVPFNVMRVVSDTPGAEDNGSQYLDFWTKAPQTTFAALKKLLG